MPNVNWIVPLRRAVVRGECSYVELLRAWAAALRESGARQALARWYPAAGEGRSLRGSTWVDAVIAGMGRAAARPASVEQGNTMDLPLPAWVRLWKGPRRVLYHPAPGAGAGDVVGAAVDMGWLRWGAQGANPCTARADARQAQGPPVLRAVRCGC